MGKGRVKKAAAAMEVTNDDAGGWQTGPISMDTDTPSAGAAPSAAPAQSKPALKARRTISRKVRVRKSKKAKRGENYYDRKESTHGKQAIRKEFKLKMKNIY
eukprot:EC720210.1.p1 GENE.EC720210.1~~EC720210.1.p1  ORF type:complete len:112 (+),score=14.71 EC720210.1:33-338(+)